MQQFPSMTKHRFYNSLSGTCLFRSILSCRIRSTSMKLPKYDTVSPLTPLSSNMKHSDLRAKLGPNAHTGDIWPVQQRFKGQSQCFGIDCGLSFSEMFPSPD